MAKAKKLDLDVTPAQEEPKQTYYGYDRVS